MLTARRTAAIKYTACSEHRYMTHQRHSTSVSRDSDVSK